MDAPADNLTIGEARAYVRQHLQSGVICPCCRQTAKIYKRALNQTMVKGLLWLVQEYSKNPGYIHVMSLGPKWLVSKGGSFATLKAWGFIEEEPPPASVEDKHKATGRWRPTPKGVLFVQNAVTVPRYVLLYNKHVIGLEGEPIAYSGILAHGQAVPPEETATDDEAVALVMDDMGQEPVR